MSMRLLQVSVKGTAGLLLSNVAYADPLGRFQPMKAYFTDKKGKSKTEGVHRAVRTLDWLFSGYWDKEGDVAVDENENNVGFENFANHYH